MIYLFTKYTRNGASSRVRTYNHIEYEPRNTHKIYVFYGDSYFKLIYLSSFGIKLLKVLFFFFAYVKRLINLCFLFFEIKNGDVIYIEKELLPYGPSFVDIFFLNVFKRKCKIVFDFDDLVYDFYNRISLLKYLISSRSNIPVNFGNVILCGNHNIISYFKKLNYQNTICFLPSTFKHKSQFFFRLDDCITIGWIGNPSTAKYLNDFLDSYRLIKNRNIKLILCGIDKSHIKADFLLDSISFMKWTEQNELIFLDKIDIGIMPLPNLEFEKYKSGYKIIQYFSHSIPVLASAVGINNDFIINDFNGRLIKFSVGELESFIDYYEINFNSLRSNAYSSYNANFCFTKVNFQWKNHLETLAM
jgi:glycosyltransferase involved in cell wall biosynthesis